MAIVTVFQDEKTYTISFVPPMPLEAALTELGLHFPHPCGGAGKCGKCAITLSGAVSTPTAAEKHAGVRLSCQTVLLDDAAVWLPDSAGMEQIQLSAAVTGAAPMAGRYGAAVDIGTTTLALSLYQLSAGELLAQSTALNPQTAVAADVIGRIKAAMEGELAHLSEMIRSAIKNLLSEACTRARVTEAEVDVLILTGNTTMLYLLMGRDPASLSSAPFQADTLFGIEVDVLDRRGYLPACMNAFVGADITCAVLASGMCSREETALLCDIGTNGELALWKDGRLYVTSTAAGPAFEGAGIRCGCGSIRGAVDRAWVEDGMLKIHTIGEQAPVGICGSGLIDLIAVCLELELVDETGAMEEDLVLDGAVKLVQSDVRAVQMAKAAIAAGIDTMLDQAGIAPDQIRRLYIAGGFGSHLNIASAGAIGLIPAQLQDRVTVIGNGALTGASQMLLNRNLLSQAAHITADAVHINLGGNPAFNEKYIEHMLFPDP